MRLAFQYVCENNAVRVFIYGCIWKKVQDTKLCGALGFFNRPLGGTPCT